MNRPKFIFGSILIILILVIGYIKINSENKELIISVGGKNISYNVSQDTNDGSDTSKDLFVFAFDTSSTYIIKEVEIGERIYLDFGKTPPDEFYVRDYLLTSEGKQQYNDKLIIDTPVSGDNEKYYFNVEINMASYLSSYHEENKLDNRGFAIITTTKGIQKTYLFVIRTKRA